MEIAADAALSAARQVCVVGDATIRASGAYAADSRAAHKNAHV